MNDLSPSSHTGLGSKHMRTLKKGGRTGLYLRSRSRRSRFSSSAGSTRPAGNYPFHKSHPPLLISQLLPLYPFYSHNSFKKATAGDEDFKQHPGTTGYKTLCAGCHNLCVTRALGDPLTKPVCAARKRSFPWRLWEPGSPREHPALFGVSWAAGRDLSCCHSQGSQHPKECRIAVTFAMISILDMCTNQSGVPVPLLLRHHPAPPQCRMFVWY